MLMLNTSLAFTVILLQNVSRHVSSFGHPRSIVITKFRYVQSKRCTPQNPRPVLQLQQMGGDEEFVPEVEEKDINNADEKLLRGEDISLPSKKKSFQFDNMEAPSTREIIKFAIPATGIWLCGPLLSLIDTSIVGLFSGTLQQAALNPAVAITDYGGLLVAFMYAATTNLIATANGDDKNVEGAPKTKKTLLASLRLGLIVGAVFGLTLGLFAPLFLRILLGGEVVDPVLVLSATRYIRIRAMGMPAAVVIGSAQSACLGIKDVRGPLLVVILAGIVNFCFDILFVPLKNSILGGSAGAAFATSLSQYAALFMFIQWLRIKPKAITETKRAQSTSRGILGKEFRIQHLFKVPHLSDIKKFVPFMVPVTTTAIGRLSGYITMSHVVSSTLGTVDMAAQQIVLAFFSCFVPICDSLSITAQTFMPGIFENKTSDRLERVKTMKKMIMNLIKVGIWYGAILFALVNCVPMISHLFTQDVLVQQSMKAAIPYVAGYFALSGVVCVGEGSLLGQKDLSFLGRAYSAYFFGVPYFLLQLKKTPATISRQVGVVNMWQIFFGYQCIRLSTWLIRMFSLMKKEEAEVVSCYNNL